MHICIYVCLYTRWPSELNQYIKCICIREYARVYVCVCVYVYMYICIFASLCVYVCACLYHTHICVCVYILDDRTSLMRYIKNMCVRKIRCACAMWVYMYGLSSHVYIETKGVLDVQPLLDVRALCGCTCMWVYMYICMCVCVYILDDPASRIGTLSQYMYGNIYACMGACVPACLHVYS